MHPLLVRIGDPPSRPVTHDASQEQQQGHHRKPYRRRGELRCNFGSADRMCSPEGYEEWSGDVRWHFRRRDALAQRRVRRGFRASWPSLVILAVTLSHPLPDRLSLGNGRTWRTHPRSSSSSSWLTKRSFGDSKLTSPSARRFNTIRREWRGVLLARGLVVARGSPEAASVPPHEEVSTGGLLQGSELQLQCCPYCWAVDNSARSFAANASISNGF
jgi:hypothetical protein